MKFMEVLTLFVVIDILVLFSVTSAQNWSEILQSIRNQQKRSQNNCKFPLFSCRLYNRFWSTKRQTGFQAIDQANQALYPGSYGQESSAYPSYALPVYAGQSYIPNQNLNSGLQAYQPSMGEYPLGSSSNAQYASYPAQSTYSAQPYGQSPNTIDVHKVLDQFIRSAGLSPQGDHQAETAHTSSFAKAGTSPVVVFKKLFSFPFYLSADPNVVDLYGKDWK